MENETPMKQSPTDLQLLWQQQTVATKRFSPAEIRNKDIHLQRTVRRRNRREYVAAVLVIAAFGVHAWRSITWFSKAGPLLIILGTLYIMFQLSTRATSTLVSGSEGITESCTQFYRKELERQRDLLRTVWRWYLGPLIPGLLVIFADSFRAAYSTGIVAIGASLGSILLTVFVFLGIWRVNAVSASELQREIDALGNEPTSEEP